MLRVISEEITAYRRQIDERKNDLPLWERKVLTCDEAAAYSGIGIRRLRKMALAKGCPFAIANGTQILIAREKFDAYMDKAENKMAKTKRRDKSRVVLRTGESQRADGTYHYSWTYLNINMIGIALLAVICVAMYYYFKIADANA